MSLSRRPLSIALTIVVLGSTALGLLASPGWAQTPKRGGVLMIGSEGETPNLDCQQQQSVYLLSLARPFYSTLVGFDLNAYPKVVGDLAESWTVSPDGKTYTFKMRPNVKFHDGSPFTSADVKATFERILKPPAGIPAVR